MKDILKKNKGKIATLVAGAVLYGIALALGIDLPLADVFAGNVGELGEALESGVDALPAE